MIYEGFRTWFTLDGQTDPGALAKLASGAASGAISQSITYPLLASPRLIFIALS
jgi:solute carrier family 25 phosphate transporter 23/24/25/41